MTALHTRLCRLAGIEFPIVQPGMGFVSDAGLTAATSEAGGLGIIGGATMGLSELADAIARVKERTSRPFGVNLRSDAPHAFERADLMIREGVRVASFALAPSERLIKTLKDGGLVCMPSIGARRHAEKVAGWGADAVIVQGSEAGGHTGAIGTMVLLPQIVDAVDIPVVAAGGFFDGRGLVAALAFGAEGIAMGTRFLLTRESPVPDPVKAVYLAKGVADTVVTDRIDGHPHRVLRTPFIDRWVTSSGGLRGLLRSARSALALRRNTGMGLGEMLRRGRALRRDHHFTLEQVVMAANTPVLLRRTMQEGEVDFGIISGGQVSGLIDDIPTVQELVTRVMREATLSLERLAA